jgi:hypothetical protein
MLDQNPDIYWEGKTAHRADEIYGDSVKKLDIAAWFKRQISIFGSRYYGKFVPGGLSDVCPLISVPPRQSIVTWAGI